MTFNEKKIYEKIDEILWRDWDPYGINDNEIIRDEYQSYASLIFRLKMQGADEMKIAAYLFELAWENMGMASDKELCEVVARKIVEI